MISREGKLFGKINVIDLFVILLAVVFICGVTYKLVSNKTNISLGTKIINYQVSIRDVKASTAKYYQKGLGVYDSKTSTYLGKIESATVNDYYDFVTDMNGVTHKSKKPDKVEILLSILGNGVETAQSFMIGGTYELKNGGEMYLLTKYADVVGVIKTIGE